jgi:hypothetical protein
VGDVANVIQHQDAPDITTSMLAGVAQPLGEQASIRFNPTVRNGDVIHSPFAGNA